MGQIQTEAADCRLQFIYQVRRHYLIDEIQVKSAANFLLFLKFLQQTSSSVFEC